MTPHDRQKELLNHWRYWLSKGRSDIVCASYVNGKWARLYLFIAKQCGAVRGRFCADGAVKVYFDRMPK